MAAASSSAGISVHLSELMGVNAHIAMHAKKNSAMKRMTKVHALLFEEAAIDLLDTVIRRGLCVGHIPGDEKPVPFHPEIALDALKEYLVEIIKSKNWESNRAQTFTDLLFEFLDRCAKVHRGGKSDLLKWVNWVSRTAYKLDTVALRLVRCYFRRTVGESKANKRAGTGWLGNISTDNAALVDDVVRHFGVGTGLWQALKDVDAKQTRVRDERTDGPTAKATKESKNKHAEERAKRITAKLPHLTAIFPVPPPPQTTGDFMRHNALARGTLFLVSFPSNHLASLQTFQTPSIR
jgi:hypothetical protein